MSEKLMSTEEVCKYLDILEEDLRKLVDKGEIPAYRLGGIILRFRKDQIDEIKARGVPKLNDLQQETLAAKENSRLERVIDFLYFNDFYIISAIIIVLLLIAIFFY